MLSHRPIELPRDGEHSPSDPNRESMCSQSNGNGNAGTIQMRNYEIDPNNPNGLINPCVVSNQSFGPPDGGDWTATFDYTECCPE